MKIHKVLGMMSGTSLDGLDLAYCHFWESESGWEFKIEKTKEIGYSKDWRDRLKNAIGLSDEAHAELDLVYGEWLGEQARIFIEESECSFVWCCGQANEESIKIIQHLFP